MNTPDIDTAAFSAHVDQQLLEQGLTLREVRQAKIENLEADACYDSTEDGTAAWWWCAELWLDGCHAADITAPSWHLPAVEITWL